MWRTAEKALDAATALKLTAEDLAALKIIDEIIPEPVGGAHRDPEQAIGHLRAAIDRNLTELSQIPGHKLKELRRQKYLTMGTTKPV